MVGCHLCCGSMTKNPGESAAAENRCHWPLLQGALGPRKGFVCFWFSHLKKERSNELSTRLEAVSNCPGRGVGAAQKKIICSITMCHRFVEGLEPRQKSCDQDYCAVTTAPGNQLYWLCASVNKQYCCRWKRRISASARQIRVG